MKALVVVIKPVQFTLIYGHAKKALKINGEHIT